MTVEWDEVGTLRRTTCGFDIRKDNLWILVTAAMQGHEGPLDAMEIETRSGVIYGPAEIQALADRADRKRG